MKKNGFTLVEVLLALAIVGVVAAITAPTLVGLIPDKRKVEVLKIYKVITDINQELMADKSLYMDGFIDDEYVSGLGNTQQPLDPEFASADYSGDCKYPRLLASKLNIKEDLAQACTSFTTLDGIVWTYNSGNDDILGNITIDLDGESGRNCSYSGGCEKPDRFNYAIHKNGVISGNDPLTTAYLKNRMKLNDKKADLEAAANDNTSYSN